MRLVAPVLALALLAGCQSTQEVPIGDLPPGTTNAAALELDSPEDVASRLRALGLDLTPESRAFSNARATGGASYLLPDARTLVVFEYPTEAARDADVPYLLAGDDAPSPGTVYTAGDRFAVIYSGTDPDVQATLRSALDPVEE